MTIKADRSVASFLKRLDTFHLDGGPSAFLKICEDIYSSELRGTNPEFTQLWERLVGEPKRMRKDENLSNHFAVRRAIKHVFQEKDRVAPNPPEVEPSLSAVRFYKR